MQIKNITLYNFKGEYRVIDFKLNSLNVITGKSKTGKSAIINIIDYCMGRSSFNIFDGVNRGVVSWYAVTYQFHDKQIFIAKQPPKNGKLSCSEACIIIQKNIEKPAYKDLAANTNDDGVRAQIEKELGFQDNLTFRTEGQEKAYAANLKHSKSYIFQEQGEIANKKHLFHRQDEGGFYIQAIKDTFPYFLGAMSAKRFSELEKLKLKKKELKKHQAELNQFNKIINIGSSKAIELLREASELGIVSDDSIVNDIDFDSCIELLRGCLRWQPDSPLHEPRNNLLALQTELSELEREYASTAEKLTHTKIFQKHRNSYSDDLLEHKIRLEPIGLFSDTEIRCPLCENKDPNMIQSTNSNLRESLESVNKLLANLSQSTPKLQNYVSELSSRENDTLIRIENKKNEIRAIVKASKDKKLLADKNSNIAKTIGKITLFLESFEKTQSDSTLVAKVNELNHDIKLLEKKLDENTVKDRLDSALNIVGSYMGIYAKKLNLEYSSHPYRLDLNKLTVFSDNIHGAIPMFRQGSGENWLGCHVITFLSLHKYFAEIKSPVPSLFVLDQPSQVHFPDLLKYKSLDGSISDNSDIDMQAVRNLFKVFHDFCSKSNTGFQIIVTEHANLADEWYQKSLVEPPWREDLALIPYSWL